jgi:hypothetical protein
MLLGLARVFFVGSESLGTRDHILLSQIWVFPFRRLLRLAGSRWRYSNPPPHGSLLSIRYNNITTIQSVSATKPNRFITFTETVAVYCENHMEHKYGLWVKYWNFKAGGTYSNHWTYRIRMIRQSYTCNRLPRPRGLWEVEAPIFSRQSANRWWWGCQPSCRPPFTPRTIPDTHFCWKLGRPQGHSAAGRMSIEPTTIRLVAQSRSKLCYRVNAKKVKLLLDLINYHATLDVWGSWDIAPLFLTSKPDGGERSASRPCRFTPGTNYIWEWVGPTVGLVSVEEKHLLPLHGTAPLTPQSSNPLPSRCTD